MRLQERDEKAHHLWIRVVEPQRIPILLAFRPIEHAARDMAAVALKGKAPTCLLVSDSFRPTVCSLDGRAAELPVVRRVPTEQFLLLRRSELDIPDPTANGRGRDAETSCNFLDRRPLLAPDR